MKKKHSTVYFLLIHFTTVTVQLYIPELCESALTLLETLLLTHQHSPRAFHSVLPQLLHLLIHTQNQFTKSPSTTTLIQESPSHNSITQTTTTTTTRPFVSLVMELHRLYTTAMLPRDVVLNEDVVSRLASLLHTLMFCHPGYPELYSSLSSLLSSYVHTLSTFIIYSLSLTHTDNTSCFIP
jgi:hypothetical protein